MYTFDCICGQTVRTPSKTGTCPGCARLYELTWPAEYGVTRSFEPEQAEATAA